LAQRSAAAHALTSFGKFASVAIMLAAFCSLCPALERTSRGAEVGIPCKLWERESLVLSGTQHWPSEGAAECAGHGTAEDWVLLYWILQRGHCFRVVLRWLSSPAMLVGTGSSGAAEMTATRQRARPDTCTRAWLARMLRAHARTHGKLLGLCFEVLSAWLALHSCSWACPGCP